MMNDFMDLELLASFGGLVLATGIVVQFTKSLIKKKFDDYAVRFYTMIIALILTFVFARKGQGIEGIILTTINSIVISVATMGGYEIIADPKAKKY